MKRRDNYSVSTSIVFTVIFAIIAIFISLAIIPTIGVLFGIVMTIIAANKASNKSAHKEQQDRFAMTIAHDSSFGNSDLKMYFNSTNKTITLCATTTTDSNQKTVEHFDKGKIVKTDEHIVAIDASFHHHHHKDASSHSFLKHFSCISRIEK